MHLQSGIKNEVELGDCFKYLQVYESACLLATFVEKPLAKTEFLKKLAKNKLNATGKTLQKGRVETDATSLRDPGSIVDQNSLAAPGNVSKSITEDIVKNATKGTS